ncbi:Phospholipase B-like, partial [Meloidogyne graminicola]
SEEKEEIKIEENEGYDTDYIYKSICILDGKPTIINNLDFAIGRFRNAINISGWSYLEIETKGNYEPTFQAYAAGYIEGILTKRVLHLHIQNTVLDYCKGYQNYCKKLMPFLHDNMQYIKRKINSAANDDPYWQAVKMAYLQLTGIWHAYTGSSFNPSILYEPHLIMLLNSNGDFYDLESKLNKTKDPIDDITGGKCSGLVKVAPNNSDLFISQVTMSGFQNMLRMLKLYKFGVDSILFPGHTSTFAGYPGVIYSSDDFALTSTGLAVIETTVKVWNKSLYENTKPQGQILCWVRAVVANLLSRTSREWCQIFKRYNSGTYNNQWAILDYKRFTPGNPLPKFGLLYVLEQMPGHVYYQDLSIYLKEKTYFASYNIPFFKKASKISGFMEKGNEFYWFNWTDCPRAKIFGRDHINVIDLDTISSRGDLNEPNGTYPLPGMGYVNHGALDYKGTNYYLAKNLRFRAWSGPTYENVPIFDWTTSNLATKVKHYGHPKRWNFKPIDYRWETEIN